MARHDRLSALLGRVATQPLRPLVDRHSAAQAAATAVRDEAERADYDDEHPTIADLLAAYCGVAAADLE